MFEKIPGNPLLDFLTKQDVQTEDLFWMRLLDRRAEWLEGNEESDSQWYLGWKVQSELSSGNPKYAYQWGYSTVKTFPDYTEMYEMLASTAKRIQ